MAETCNTCRFYRSRKGFTELPDGSQVSGYDLGECRRYGPERGKAPIGETHAALWPIVRAEDWCGEYRHA